MNIYKETWENLGMFSTFDRSRATTNENGGHYRPENVGQQLTVVKRCLQDTFLHINVRKFVRVPIFYRKGPNLSGLNPALQGEPISTVDQERANEVVSSSSSSSSSSVY